MSLTFKRHYPLIVLLALMVITLVLGMGDQRIIAYQAQDSAQAVKQSIYLAQAEFFNLLAR